MSEAAAPPPPPPPPPPAPLPPFEWIADDAALARAMERIAAAAGRKEPLYFDTETNGLHAYKSRICLVQVFAGGVVHLLDVLRLGLPDPLAQILRDRAAPKVLHGASHDIASLKEDFTCPLRGIFDTYVAANFLSLPKVSLADLLLERCNVPHDKSWQKKDWTIRPLPPDALEYLARDVAYLPALAEGLREEVRSAGMLEEVEVECRRVEETSATGNGFDPIGYLEMKGTEALETEGWGVLREVWLERDRWARETDRPAFKILPDGILLALAKGNARSPSHLKSYRPFLQGGPWGGDAARAREDFFKAILRGREHRGVPEEDEIEAERRERAKEEEMVRGPRGRRGRIEGLKEWRKGEAAKRKVAPIVVLPNWAIQDLATEPPKNLEELSAAGIGNGRVARYGKTILQILSSEATREKDSAEKNPPGS